jgi:hypothetical protein
MGWSAVSCVHKLRDVAHRVPIPLRADLRGIVVVDGDNAETALAEPEYCASEDPLPSELIYDD